MDARLVRQMHKLKRARPRRAAPAPRRGLADPPRKGVQALVVVDVDVDLVGHLDRRLAAAEAELAAEEEQENEDDDDQQHDGKHAATASTAASLDNRRVFALGAVI